jgi:hypothetical protein
MMEVVGAKNSTRKILPATNVKRRDIILKVVRVKRLLK